MKTTEQRYSQHDEVLAELRRYKTEIAQEHGFDVRSLAKDLQKRQQHHPQLVSPPAKVNLQVKPA